MRSPATIRPAWSRSVFINCPFDDAYKPLLRAMCFAIMACGHIPRCAFDASDSVAGVIRCVRDWLNINGTFAAGKEPAGAAAIQADYQVYRRLAPDIAEGLRLDPHNDLPHRDYLRVVEIALPMIELARRAKP